MTESAWLTTTDALAMLDHLRDDNADAQAVGVYSSHILTPRKLHAWAEAVLGWKRGDLAQVRGVYPNSLPDTLTIRAADIGSNGDMDNYAVAYAKNGAASLLRCAVGNPFRTLGPLRFIRSYLDDVQYAPVWLTPTVLSLAEEASEKRRQVKCRCCDGKRTLSRQASHGHEFMGFERFIEEKQCHACDGTGTEDGHFLDNATLSILADALIDAGHPETARCRLCDGSGINGTCWDDTCGLCEGDKVVRHPLIDHLRNGENHLSVCHVLNLLRGSQ